MQMVAAMVPTFLLTKNQRLVMHAGIEKRINLFRVTATSRWQAFSPRRAKLRSRSLYLVNANAWVENVFGVPRQLVG